MPKRYKVRDKTSGEVFSFKWGKAGKPSLSDAREVLRLQKEHKANIEAGRAQDRSFAARAANVSEFMRTPTLNIPEPIYPGPMGVTSLAAKGISALSTPENLAMGALTAAAPWTAPAVGAYYGGESLAGAAESAMKGEYGEAALQGAMGLGLAIPSLGSIARRPVPRAPTPSPSSAAIAPDIIPESLRDPNLNLNNLADALEANPGMTPEAVRRIVRNEPAPPPGSGTFDPLQSRPQIKPEIISPTQPGLLDPNIPGQFRHTLPPPEYAPETITPEIITPETIAPETIAPEGPPPVEIPPEATFEDIIQTRRRPIPEPEPAVEPQPKGEFEDFLRERLEKPTVKEAEPTPELKISDKRIQEEEPVVTAPSRLQKTVSNIREETLQARMPKVEEPEVSIPEPASIQKMELPKGVTFRKNVEGLDYYDVDIPGGKPTMIGVGPGDDLAAKVEETLNKFKGKVPEDMKVEGGSFKTGSSDYIDAVIKELDSKKAPDIEYQSLFSTTTKNKLKKGETWRGRAIEYRDYKRRLETPEVEAPPFKERTAEIPKVEVPEVNIPKSQAAVEEALGIKAEIGPESGKPYKMKGYHATMKEFEKFDPKAKSRTKEADLTAKGKFYYADKSEAERIHLGEGKRRIIEEDVEFKNPFVFQKFDELYKYTGVSHTDPKKAEKVTAALRAKGHDGYIKKYQSKPGIDEVVTLHPEEVPTPKPEGPKIPTEEFKGKTPEELYDVKEVGGRFILKDKATGKTVTVERTRESAWEAAKKRIKEFGSKETGAISIQPKQKVGSTAKRGSRDQFVDDMVNRGMDRDQAERNADALFGKGNSSPPIIKVASVSPDPNIRSAAAQADEQIQRSAFKKVYDFGAMSIETQIRRKGPAGEEIADRISRARLRGDSYAGQWGRRANEAVKGLNDKQFDEFVESLDKGVTSSDPAVSKAVNTYKQLDDEVVAKAIAAKLGKKDPRTGKVVPFTGRANYFPHIYPKEFFDKLTKDKSFRDSVIDSMMKKGLSRAQAERVLKQSRQHGERLISAQHGRDPFEVPGWMRDKKVLIRHLDDMGKRIARAEELGAEDIRSGNTVVSQLIEKTSEPSHVRRLLKRVLGDEDPHPEEFVKVARAITNAESLLHLSHFAISNLNQMAMIPVRSNFRATAKAAWRAATDAKKFYNDALDSGSIVEVTHREILDEMGGRGLAGKLYGFGVSEKLQRMFASGVGRADAELTFKALKKNPGSARLKRHLKTLLIENPDDVLKQGALSEEQIHMAGSRMAEITQGLAGPQDLPPVMSAHPLLNLVFLYKRFAFRGTKLIADAIKERPIANTAKALALLPLAGEITGDIKAGISGAIQGDIGKEISERSERLPVTGNKAIDRLIANYMQAWALGIVGDILESAYSGQSSGLLQFFGGPVTSDVAETGSGIAQLTKGKPKPLLKKATQSVPFVGTGLRKKLFPSRRPSGSVGPQVESPAF